MQISQKLQGTSGILWGLHGNAVQGQEGAAQLSWFHNPRGTQHKEGPENQAWA